MATITLSEVGKEIEDGVRFVFAHTAFALKGNESFESDDPGLVSDAAAHPFLKVDFSQGKSAADEIKEQADAVAASDDPTVNVRADHLSALADPEVVEAAQKRAQAIREAVAGEPSVQQTENTQDKETAATKPVAATPPAPVAPVTDRERSF